MTSVQTVFRQKLHAIIEVTLLALNVQIKNILKHDRNRVSHVDFRMQLHYLLVVVVVSDVSDVKVMSSTVAVIFAVN